MDIILIILLIILSPVIFVLGLILIFVIAAGAINLIEAILRCSANVFNGIGNWFTRDRKDKKIK